MYRYMLQLQIIDCSGQYWCTCFDDVAVILLGMSADEMQVLQESDDGRFDAAFKNLLFRRGNFKLKVSQEEWQGEVRQKVVIQRFAELDYVAETDKLADMLQRMRGGEEVKSEIYCWRTRS